MPQQPFFAGQEYMYPEQTAEQQSWKRKQRLADTFSAQALENPQGQMVSGHYIAPGWGQAVARVLQGYMGGKLSQDTEQEQRKYAEEMNRKLAEGLKNYGAISQGSPETKTQPEEWYPGDPGGNVQRPAVQPNPRGAAESLVNSGHPLLHQAGVQQILSTKQDEFGTEPRYDQNGRAFLVGKSGQIKYIDGVQARDKVEVGPGGQAYNPYQLKPGQVLNDPNKPFGMNEQGIQPNNPYQAYEIAKANAGGTKINMPAINLNTEKTYAGNVAEGLAKNDVSAIDVSRSAPQRITAAQEVKRILDTDKTITGTGAEWRLAANKALATAGIIDGSSVKNTENLASNLASQTLEAIKSSGLGSGQGFTDKDRQFLERAKSGNIEINRDTLRYLADINERAARKSIDYGNKVAERIKNHPAFGSVGQDLFVQQPGEYKSGQSNSGFKYLGKE